MRKILFAIAAMLAIGGGCKKTESEKAARDLTKAQERVEDQRGDVANEMKDMRDEAKDVATEQRELNHAEGDLAVAKERLRRESSIALDRIEEKLARLEASTNAEARADAAALRVRKAELQGKLDHLGAHAAATWNTAKIELGDALGKLEKDVDAIKP